MSAFEWVITIGLMIVAVIMALLAMSFFRLFADCSRIKRKRRDRAGR